MGLPAYCGGYTRRSFDDRLAPLRCKLKLEKDEPAGTSRAMPFIPAVANEIVVRWVALVFDDLATGPRWSEAADTQFRSPR